MAADEAPLRVLLTVHHELETGTGAAGSTLAIAEGLERRGHRVEVVGLELLGHRRNATVDAMQFPHAVARLARRRLASGDLDVLDASTGDLAYVRADAVRTSPVAVLTRSHGLEHLNAERRREGARRGELRLRRRYGLYHGGFRLHEVARSLRCADGVLALNDAEAAYVVSSLRIEASRVHRTSELLRDLPAPSATTEVRDLLVLGPAAWRKGGDVAVRVLDAVLRASPATTASWHGLDDPSAVASRLGSDVRDRVVAAGRYDAAGLATLLASHRLLLFLSRAEGLGMTVLEAMTAGLAVLASDVPGPRDLLAGGCGVLEPDGHVEAMAAAALRLLADDAERARLAAAGRARAAGYATDVVLARLVATYRDVCARKAAALTP
jgi:glycosyltransferase involved in cell wall biosynthesis